MGAKTKRSLMATGLALAIIATAAAGLFYLVVFAPNVKLEGPESTVIHIPSGSAYEDVREMLIRENLLRNSRSFEWLARRKNYPARIMPGRYRIVDGMSNNSLINLLRSGEQEAVNLVFNNIRSVEQLASVIAEQIEADSLSIVRLFSDNHLMEELGVDSQDLKLLFIPNTYQVYWTTSPRQLFHRMEREYHAFWNENRRAQAREAGLSLQEVGILASIVQSETSKQDEMPRIAGVFMNRLQRNIPLQADPTVIFAIGDFSIRRVLNSHLAYDSPYNTYLYAGLPPGPIRLPEPHSIDAVLNYEEHDYLYFSAKEDFSGYHVFARTYREHLDNARRYRRALDQLRVFR